jgi:hypothetical protein
MCCEVYFKKIKLTPIKNIFFNCDFKLPTSELYIGLNFFYDEKISSLELIFFESFHVFDKIIYFNNIDFISKFNIIERRRYENMKIIDLIDIIIKDSVNKNIYVLLITSNKLTVSGCVTTRSYF